MPPLPVVPHQLTKIRSENRVLLVRFAFFFSVCAVFSNIISAGTNNWLNTSELLKYFVLPNRTVAETLTPFHCTKIDVFALDDPSDVTTAVELSVRRCAPFIVAGCCMDSLGMLSVCICLSRKRPYKTLLFATVTNIFTGLVNFTCIIVYITSVSKEVGNKIYKASRIDDSLFHYSYGFSFIMLKISFLCTELTALFCVVVFMAKRDERAYNAYKIRSMLRNLHKTNEINKSSISNCSLPYDQILKENELYYKHARVNTLRRKSVCSQEFTQQPLQLIAACSTLLTVPTEGEYSPKQSLMPNNLRMTENSSNQALSNGYFQ
uniref:G_PROTEIN_RECEP_F1_2 domain-containing protein n=1 Tax=Meloidogyne floridensis TaxID=298350 RepID=A0A915NTL7_9BILA